MPQRPYDTYAGQAHRTAQVLSKYNAVYQRSGDKNKTPADPKRHLFVETTNFGYMYTPEDETGKRKLLFKD